jgi:aerobic carbon-monoxide dehydrogenase medium subunit
MKPPPFKYTRPRELNEVLELLSEYGDEAKLLAGGQSLVPMLNFRLLRPSVLIDLNAIGGLDTLGSRNGMMVVGPMVRQSTAEASPDVLASAPLLVQALRHVGHVQIRNRGTIGGSLIHAAPAAELPAVALVLDAELVLRNLRAERVVTAADFFRGPFTTAAEPDEVLTEIRFHSLVDTRTAFVELAMRSGDFALAGVAALARVDSESGVFMEVRLAAIGVAGGPVRLSEAEAAVTGRQATREALRDGGAAAAAEVTPSTDVHASGSYRKEVLGVLAARALAKVSGT